MKHLYKTIAGVDALPVVNVQKFSKLDKGFYSVIFASAAISKHYTQADYDAAIAKLYDNKLRIVANSLFPVQANANKPMFRCILEAVTASIPFDDASIKEAGLHPVQANVFADEDDGIWKVVGDNDYKRLVQVSEDNFDELLEAKKVRNPISASYDEQVPVFEGEFVHFMNTASGELDFGFALEINGNGKILSKASGQLVDVDNSAVLVTCNVSSIAGSPMQKKLELMTVADYDVKQLIDYLRMLYGGSDMIRDLEKTIRAIGVH